ncbi:MAG: M28 family peptidase [Flavisolibacter sp.]
MKKAIANILLSITFLSSFAQSNFIDEINKACPPGTTLEPMRFLASDELMGRSTLRPEIHIAARYISEQFRSAGVKTFPKAIDYYQPFDITLFSPAKTGFLRIKDAEYSLVMDLLQINGIHDISITAPIVFIGYGSEADFDRADVRGKIVITNMGKSDSTPEIGRQQGNLRAQKVNRAIERGAVALVDRYKQTDSFWEGFQGYLSNERTWVDSSFKIPVFLLNDQKANILSLVQPGVQATIKIGGNHMKLLAAQNVIGWVEGTDKALKSQFIVLSAHYDHMGIVKPVKTSEGKLDSVMNGARDNAIGVAAVISAARYFAQHPAKRSILFVAYTGEELGLKGSKYFAEHSPISLRQMIFNLNIDNAGYNDTTIVTIIGMGRTSVDHLIQKACLSFGLTAKSDPSPAENLFERSDNLSLAEKGLPAPTFSLGIRKFDEEINKYYHEVIDEVQNFDLNYAMKYIKSYILSAKFIADSKTQPKWQKDDKFESAWIKLFGQIKNDNR